MLRNIFMFLLAVFAVSGIFCQDSTAEQLLRLTNNIDAEQVKETVSYSIGDRGPGGGIVFFAGDNSYLEVSGALGFHSWTAAKTTAGNYTGGGFTDWRLPTREELNQIYLNLRRRNLGSIGDDIYWSSTENDSSTAWYQSMGNGIQRSGNIRSFSLNVRAVREI